MACVWEVWAVFGPENNDLTLLRVKNRYHAFNFEDKLSSAAVICGSQDSFCSTTDSLACRLLKNGCFRDEKAEPVLFLFPFVSSGSSWWCFKNAGWGLLSWLELKHVWDKKHGQLTMWAAFPRTQKCLLCVQRLGFSRFWMSPICHCLIWRRFVRVRSVSVNEGNYCTVQILTPFVKLLCK